MDIWTELSERISKERPDKERLTKLKKELTIKYGHPKIPSDIEVLIHCSKEEHALLKNILATKPQRTASGVAVVAVMSEPRECPHAREGGPCAMCPGGPGSAFGSVPQSYTGREPATMRAIRNRFDAFLQVFNRLEQYVLLGQSAEKVEAIIMGGTFPSYDKQYQETFVRDMFAAFNTFSDMFYHDELDLDGFREFFELPGKVDDPKREEKVQQKILMLKNLCLSLEQEQAKNELARIRCVGLTIETRPDYGILEHGLEMLRLGCTRVELGVQSTRDSVLSSINRGHTVQQSKDSTRILKDLGFKINYHMMPGLPGSSPEDDRKMLLEIQDDPGFRPDMLKIYPAMVLPGTRLHAEWEAGKFKPMTTKQAAEVIASFKREVKPWLRIMRVQRDIPTDVTSAGVDRTNLRQYVLQDMKGTGDRCRCIRCREPRPGKKYDPKLHVLEYEASGGREFFISFEDEDVLLGFCRLRFPGSHLTTEIDEGTAIIRELHVYGAAAGLGQEGEIQHRGLGKRLVEEAESVSRGSGKSKLAVISGVGVREYYRRLGYERQGPYMVKIF